MADFISNRTGQQMNDALKQMNDRMPEQWTTGQIDGVDVPESNPRYHNNAKYYAEQAGEHDDNITGMTVSSETLEPDEPAEVIKTGGGNEPVNLHFGIPQGIRGETIESVEYQEGTSATIIPTGTWSETPVFVAQGRYLWTRTTFTDGIKAYTVARQGMDGSGAGDMKATDYDDGYTVLYAGGIVPYVSEVSQGLQEQIDAIVAKSDIVDIVGTYAELQAYSKPLYDGDIIKVLSDESRGGAQSYYRWDSDTEAFVFVGSEAPYYSKSETNDLLGQRIPYTGGTLTGKLIAQVNTDYTARQVHNIVFSTSDPSGGQNGDIWIKYEV